jgi:hypothetical protein
MMLRRNPTLLFIVALAGTLIWPSAANAKGSVLRFNHERYLPGEHAVAHAEVETWKGSGQPEDGPFTVYLVRSGPLHFGFLPRDAIEVGELGIGGLVGVDTYRVTVAFNVPRLPSGRYSVWVCGARSGGTGCWLGFGDLVYGEIDVVRNPGPGPGPGPLESVTPSLARVATRRTVPPWSVISLLGVACALVISTSSRTRRVRGRGRS